MTLGFFKFFSREAIYLQQRQSILSSGLEAGGNLISSAIVCIK